MLLKESVEAILQNYPKDHQKSALLPLLDKLQRENGGFLSSESLQEVATILKIPYMHVYEVATFYSLFRLQPTGRYHIKICGTVPCCFMGSEDLKQSCQDLLSLDINETTPDHLFTLSEFECLGACVNAPVIQINDDYIENVSIEGLKNILTQIKNHNNGK